MVVSAFLTFPTYEVQNVTGKLSRKNINLMYEVILQNDICR